MTALYNRYISEHDPYIPIGEERIESGQKAGDERVFGGYETAGKDPSPVGRGQGGLLQGVLGNFGLDEGGFSSILKRLHLEDLDSGDILLGLIILFLILEDGDNLDLIITLGLMILFSLGEP